MFHQNESQIHQSKQTDAKKATHKMEQSKEEKQTFLHHYLKYVYMSNQVRLSFTGEEYVIQPFYWENMSSMEKLRRQKT